MSNSTALNVLAGTGAVLLIPCLYRLSSFIWLHFLRPSSIKSYVHGAAPYALVTGATDGIGKGVAKELYRRGFNLILHGRNAEKMERVREEIQSLGVPRKNVKVWIADADDPEVGFEGAVAQWEGLEITLVVHNVGGAPPRDPT